MPKFHYVQMLNLLPLFCFINYSETPPVGNALVTVTGKKGSNITLLCTFEANEISQVDLIRESDDLEVCKDQKNCSGRIFREGSCDVVIKDLRFGDAGKYILRVHYKKDQEVRREKEERTFQLQILDEISVQKGEDLELDVLLINADKVERSSSSGWTELWTRGHGVSSDRLTVSNQTLTISNITVNDTVTYRVLDSDNETLITVTVTESGKGSKEKLDTEDDHKPNEQNIGIIVPSVCGPLLGLGLVGVVVFVIWKRQHENRSTAERPYQEIPMSEREVKVVQNI
ncbi:hypothetical protein R3I94_018524 [Phoxinus phoxinus]